MPDELTEKDAAPDAEQDNEVLEDELSEVLDKEAKEDSMVTQDPDKPSSLADMEEAEDIVHKQNKQLAAKDKQLVEMQARLDESEKANKYNSEPAEIPEEQKALPKGMQESEIKTTVRDFSSIIKEKMMQLKDMATMEVLLDTSVRMRKRMESIKDMSSAKSIKVRGMWRTEAPQMHISSLEGRKISNEEYEITFGVYEVDDKGDKKLYTHYADVRLHNGDTINRAMSAEYRVAYEVVERIKTGKPITREVITLTRVQEAKNE